MTRWSVIKGNDQKNTRNKTKNHESRKHNFSLVIILFSYIIITKISRPSENINMASTTKLGDCRFVIPNKKSLLRT